ncbi:hypothetical protein FPL01_12710 [Bacillus pacificus]|uniref:Uncharacterized protein n=1 Tax=Bacillus pacificus TaxID=2026187 RepID=A0ABX6I6M5_9BACI|nr:hypothetical protein AT277_15985 [Bacillus cereus]KXY96832.1 hypothetical protein AT276_13020 [Bacillus cereus]PEB06505.1 hypothetical protein COM56_14065 [Bacillus cereus]QHH89529.1 hypothetical protein FPL01_12710 [Bacillus pacificus]RRB08562.1 hypothetical protein EH195_02870 [Bacillus pacificus]
MYRLFLFRIKICGRCIVLLFYASFYTLITVFSLVLYLFLFYILHKNKSADTIQTSNKYSIKLLNIHY